MGVINLMKGLFYGGNHMYYIGVDLGTSSLKLLLMDEKGKIQNIVSKEYNLYRQNFCGCIFSKRESEERMNKQKNIEKM